LLAILGGALWLSHIARKPIELTLLVLFRHPVFVLEANRTVYYVDRCIAFPRYAYISALSRADH
jgi:hypothetical protein